MTTNYPTSLDSFPAVAGTMADTPTHSDRHTNLQDAIAAIQAALGTSPAGSWASVKARLEAIEANDWVTAARIAANAVGTSELADNAVDTAAIADGAVSVVKLTGAYGAKTANYTITASDSVIAADTTSGAFALTLPAASASTGKTLRIIKTAGAYTLTVQRAASDTILPSSGTRTSVAFPSDCAMGEMLLVSNGSAWHVVSGQASDETVGSRLYKWSQALAGGSTTAAVGWRLVAYDSGRRNITALGMLNGWVADSMYLQRRNNTVFFEFAGDSRSATNGALFQLPAGFRPTCRANKFAIVNEYVLSAIGVGEVNGPEFNAYVTAGYRWGATNGGQGIGGSPVFAVAEAPPTSLPGSAA